jgi:hypothetical protein
MKRPIGRSTTSWIVTLMSTPMRTTEPAASVSAQNRIRDVSSSARWVEIFAATAPTIDPSRAIGAMISQYRSPAAVTARATTWPARISSASFLANGIRVPG